MNETNDKINQGTNEEETKEEETKEEETKEEETKEEEEETKKEEEETKKEEEETKKEEEETKKEEETKEEETKEEETKEEETKEEETKEEETKEEEEEEPKIIILNSGPNNTSHILTDYMKGRTKIYNLGSGPSFETVEPTDDNFIICQNHTILAQKKCDLFVFGDFAILQEPNLLPLLSNVKFLLVNSPLHQWGPPVPQYNEQFIINETKKYFKGYYIFHTTYNLNMHKHTHPCCLLSLNYYRQFVNTHAIGFPQAHIVSTCFILIHLLKYQGRPNIKYSYGKPPQELLTISDIKYQIHYYGILGEKPGDKGRPYSEIITKLRDPTLLARGKQFIANHPSMNSGTAQMLSFKTHILDIYRYFSESIDFTLH